MIKENKKLLITLICSLVFIVTLTTILVLVVNNRNGKKEEKKDYNPNDVVIDSFTYSLLKLETNNNNLVYSPLSIKYALSMLKEGASGKTKEEIETVLGDNKVTKYKNIDKVLSLANAVYIRDTFKDFVKDNYIDTLNDKYNAEIFYDKFENANNVNSWIEKKTFNLIKNMLSDDLVQSEDVEMLLVNALAIDMEWENKFSNENTYQNEFTIQDGEKMSVGMMNMTTDTNTIKYYKDKDYTEVAMPFKEYDGVKLEFVAIMPNEESLNKVLTDDKLEDNLSSLLNKLHTVNKEELVISLPRFDFDYKVSLKDDLNVMGIKTAFSTDADFSNMSSSSLKVDDVLHKATIKCSERGVKAAAATVIVMKDNAMHIENPKEQVVLNFDKPFMFVIRDTSTNEIWFTGTVYKPLEWETIKDDYKYE